MASADQRALSLAGIFIAIATAILGAIVTSEVDEWLLASSIVTALGFYISAGLCLSSALPRMFYLSSSGRVTWDYYLGENATTHEINMAMYSELSRRISENEVALIKGARKFKMGAWLGLSAPIIGAAIYLISFCLCS